MARLLKTKELWEVVYALVPEAHNNQRHQPQITQVKVGRARDEQITAIKKNVILDAT